MAEVEHRIRKINAKVPIKKPMNSEVEMDCVLGIQGFSLDKIIDMNEAFLEDDNEHQQDSLVSSMGIDVAGKAVQQKLNQLISWLLREKGVDLFRTI